jgi:hypothetical protein
MGGPMKKFAMIFEEIWVAVAFAEAGEYDSLREMPEVLYDPVRIEAI